MIGDGSAQTGHYRPNRAPAPMQLRGAASLGAASLGAASVVVAPSAVEAGRVRGEIIELRPGPSTAERILDAALSSFGARGYEATSLDRLAAGLGVRKQTILHHFGSKEGLLEAVLRRSAKELASAVDAGLARPGNGWDRVSAVVRAVFRLAGRRPELLGFVREVGRLGPPFVTHLTDAMAPLVARGTAFLETEVRAGSMRAHDARLVLLSGYSAVIGAATEVEVLRSLGVAPSARVLVRRRRELLADLATALRPYPASIGTGLAREARRA